MTGAPELVKPFSRAMLLAAGLGTRMRPLTDTRPKPLIEVAGRTLADHVLDRLAEAGVERVIINVHYLADAMEAHLAERSRPNIVISDERTGLLDSGGGVYKALPFLGPAPFVVCNSDSFWIETGAPVIPAMTSAWNPAAMDIMLLVASLTESVGYDGSGDYRLDETGRLVRRTPGESAPYAYAGVLLIKPELFEDRPDVFSLNRLFDEAQARGRLFGKTLDGIWLHVGTPGAIAAAEERIALTAAA